MVPTISSSHTLFFHGKVPVTPAVLAESLLGLEGVVARSGEVFRHLVPGIGPVTTQVLIERIEVGSLYDHFLVQLFFGKGKKAEKKIAQLRKDLKLEDMSTGKVISILIVGSVLWVAMQHLVPGDPERLRIENSFNDLSIQLHLTPAQMHDLYRGGVKNPETLKRDVIRMVSPDGQKLEGQITLDNDFIIPAQAVAALPGAYEKAEPDRPEEDLSGVPIVVRALDLDRPGKGWAVVLPEREGGDKRLPLEILDHINPLSIPAGKIIYADITLIHRKDRHGNRTPIRVVLRDLP